MNDEFDDENETIDANPGKSSPSFFDIHPRIDIRNVYFRVSDKLRISDGFTDLRHLTGHFSFYRRRRRRRWRVQLIKRNSVSRPGRD